MHHDLLKLSGFASATLEPDVLAVSLFLHFVVLNRLGIKFPDGPGFFIICYQQKNFPSFLQYFF